MHARPNQTSTEARYVHVLYAQAAGTPDVQWHEVSDGEGVVGGMAAMRY